MWAVYVGASSHLQRMPLMAIENLANLSLLA